MEENKIIIYHTANQHPSSVCFVGPVMVRNGQIADVSQLFFL